MILRYKLCDFIKIHDDYVNDPMKGDFQKTLLLFHIRGRVLSSVGRALACESRGSRFDPGLRQLSV